MRAIVSRPPNLAAQFRFFQRRNAYRRWCGILAGRNNPSAKRAARTAAACHQQEVRLRQISPVRDPLEHLGDRRRARVDAEMVEGRGEGRLRAQDQVLVPEQVGRLRPLPPALEHASGVRTEVVDELIRKTISTQPTLHAKSR